MHYNHHNNLQHIQIHLDMALVERHKDWQSN